MNYPTKQIIIWIGKYFPSVPRFFGLKILTLGYTDITPYMGIGNECGRTVESKVSWLVKNEWGTPLPIKVIISCAQEGDGWVQAYPVDEALHGGWDRDICCGEETFDAKRGKKSRNTIVPSHRLLKIDHFATQHPHPSHVSSQAFEIKPEDTNVIIRYENLLKNNAVKIWVWIVRILIGILFSGIIACLLAYFWVTYALPTLKHFFP